MYKQMIPRCCNILVKYFSKQNYSSIIKCEQIKNDGIFLNDKYGSFRYESIISMSFNLRNKLLTDTNFKPGNKVAILCSNNYTYLVSLLGIWLANGIPVPLNKHFSASYLEYFINDSKAKLIIKSYDHIDFIRVNRIQKNSLFKIPILKLNESEFFMSTNATNSNESFESMIKMINFKNDNKNDALIIYTSGSSGPAKGVQFSFSNLIYYMQTLMESWKMNSNDCILHVTPLNHVHGLIYSLMLPFFVGAQVVMLPSKSADSFERNVWLKLVDTSNHINILSAVPSLYTRLIDFYKKDDKFREQYRRDDLNNIIKSKMRIMATGSAPLNTKIFNNWYNLTGFKLIERYGLTEAGVCLANSCDETISKRIPGYAGRPFGQMKIRLSEINDQYECTGKVLMESDAKKDTFYVDNLKYKSISGELQVSGPMLFKGYLNNDDKTKEAFTADGWFKTGLFYFLYNLN
jgi:malonyl-CoA/methylmalonyl-CoA synthetase